MEKNLTRAVLILCGVMLLIVVVQSVHPFSYVQPTPPVKEVPCIGDPIPVDFSYTGSVNDPWTCQVQCSDDKPRYVLYTNGKGTQCETPPGCNDYGEDHGITCAVSAPKSLVQ